MEVLKYLVEPFMLLFTHNFTILGYTINFFEVWFFGALIVITGVGLAKLFGGD